MMKLIAKAVATVAACMTMAAHAQVVDWHVEGVVGSLATPQFTISTTPTITGYTSVNSIGQLSVGQGFVSDFVVNLATNSIVSASFKTTDGLLNYAPGVTPFTLNANATASIKGDLFASGANAQPPMLYGFTMTANGTGLSGAASLSDISHALATSAYTSVTASSLLYPGYAPLAAQLGQATFTITSAVVVPETSTLPMLSIGLLGLAGVSYRKRRPRSA